MQAEIPGTYPQEAVGTSLTSWNNSGIGELVWENLPGGLSSTWSGLTSRCRLLLSDFWNETDWKSTALGSATFLSKRQYASEYFALPAQFHFFLPGLLHLALTDRPIDEPAEVSDLKFPCRTVLLNLSSALSYHPTRVAFLLKYFL